MSRRRRNKPRQHPGAPDPASRLVSSRSSSQGAHATTRTAAALAGPYTSPPVDFINRAALLILLALIPLRAVILETHTFELPRLFRNIAAPPGAQPGTTLFIVALIGLIATLVCCARLSRQGRRYRWTGAEPGAGLLVVAGVVSVLNAGQKHLALIGTLDFLGMVLYMLTLRQLLTRPWHIRLATTVILATGAMVVAKCAYQHYYEFPLTVEFYEEQKAQLTQNAPDSPIDPLRAGRLHDYEQRLRSGAVTGYFGHANVLGSYLILVVMVGIAVATGRYRRRPAWSLVVPLLVGVAGVVTLIGTQSKGAVAACAIAIVIWAVWRWIAARMRASDDTPPQSPAADSPASRLVSSRSSSQSRPRRSRIVPRLWIVFWLAMLIAGLGVGGVLTCRPDAFGRSMQFRSMYWQGAWDMLADRGPWGVGANNFGRLFTRYKSVECPEEVQSPHSWIVAAAAEWGVIGLAGVLLLFVGVSRQLARAGPRFTDEATMQRRARPPPPARRDAPVQEGSIIIWIAGVSAIAFGWYAWLLAGADPGYWAITILVAAAPWVVGFAVCAIEKTESTRIADDSPGPLLAGLCAGMIGFLLHAGIDLAMFHSGAATTFFAVMAVALALRQPHVSKQTTEPGPSNARHPQPSEPARLVPVCREPARLVPVFPSGGSLALGAFGLAAVALLLIFLVLPATQLGRLLETSRRSKAPPTWRQYMASSAFAAYADASALYTLDGTALEEWTYELSRRVSNARQVDFAIDCATAAQRRDPNNIKAWHHLARLYERRFDFGHDPTDLERAVANLRQAVAAYPTSPSKRLALADLLERQAEATGSPEARGDAAKELQLALDLDERRKYVSEPHHFTVRMRQDITAKIKYLRSQSTGPTEAGGDRDTTDS